MYTKYTGVKFNKDLPIKDIVKIVRSELKELKKLGVLDDFKISYSAKYSARFIRVDFKSDVDETTRIKNLIDEFNYDYSEPWNDKFQYHFTSSVFKD